MYILDTNSTLSSNMDPDPQSCLIVIYETPFFLPAGEGKPQKNPLLMARLLGGGGWPGHEGLYYIFIVIKKVPMVIKLEGGRGERP